MTNKRTTLPLQLHPISFDLGLAKFALIVDIVVHLFIPAAKDPLLFTALTIVGCMGVGFSPAIQSVAMGVYTQQGGTELGKLFGALSVMSALRFVSLSSLVLPIGP